MYIENIFEKLSLKRIYIHIYTYILKFLIKRVYPGVYQRKILRSKYVTFSR